MKKPASKFDIKVNKVHWSLIRLVRIINIDRKSGFFFLSFMAIEKLLPSFIENSDTFFKLLL